MEIFQIYISFNIVQIGGIYLETSQIVLACCDFNLIPVSLF